MKVQEAFDNWIESHKKDFPQGISAMDKIMFKAGYESALSDIEKCEPVGWQFYQDGKWHNGMETNNHKENTIDAGIPIRELYTSPQPREWVGLSDDEIVKIMDGTEFNEDNFCILEAAINYCRAIESALKQINIKG